MEPRAVVGKLTRNYILWECKGHYSFEIVPNRLFAVYSIDTATKLYRLQQSVPLQFYLYIPLNFPKISKAKQHQQNYVFNLPSGLQNCFTSLRSQLHFLGCLWKSMSRNAFVQACSIIGGIAVIIIVVLTLLVYKQFLRILPSQIACAVLFPVIGMSFGYGECLFFKNVRFLEKREPWM